ncbi:DotA/TraY family protein [Achromobacter xylosoxidans]
MSKIRIIIMSMLLFIAGNSYAGDLFTPLPGDKSMDMLKSIFGGVGVFGSGGDPLLAFIEVINLSVIAVSGLIVGYFILSLIHNSAHDGQVLGKKHGNWTVIRMASMAGIMLPVIKGYTILQVLVAWITVQGIGIADSAVVNFTKNSNFQQTISASIVKPEAKQLGAKLFLSSVCMAVLDKYVKLEENNIIFPDSQIGMTKESISGGNRYLFGNKKDNNGITPEACGFLKVMDYKAPKDFSEVLIGKDAFAQLKAIQDKHNSLSASMITKMDSLASQLVNGGSIDVSSIEKIIFDYESGIKDTALEVVSKMDQYKTIQENINKDGWIMLGFYDTKINSMSNMVNQSVSALPYASGPINFPTKILKSEYSIALSTAIKLLEKSDFGVVSYGLIAEADGGGSFLDKIKQWINNGLDPTELITKMFTTSTYAVNSNQNPMMTLNSWGGFLLALAGTGLAGMITLLVTIGNAPGIGSAISFFLNATVPILSMLGGILKFVFPMIPVLIWIGCIVGFVLMVVEAIIACGFWGIMILNPDGHDVAGLGGNGFRLMIALLFKPVLLVAGFVTSIVIMNTLGVWLSGMFGYIFAMTQSDSGFLTWLVGIIFSPIMYGLIMYFFVKKTYSIIHVLPDEILKWIGGGSTGFGGHATSMGGGEMMAVGAVIGSTVKGIGGIGGSYLKGTQPKPLLPNGNGGGSSRSFDDRHESSNSSSNSNEDSNNPSSNYSSSNSTDSIGSNGSNESGSYSSLRHKATPKSRPSRREGKVVDFGHAPYKNNPDNAPSYFVKVNSNGKTSTAWGVDLERGIQENGINIGDEISIEKVRKENGRLIKDENGNEITHKNIFDIKPIDKDKSD